MSDLFSPFRDAEQLPTPPVEDVRRRGDSLRRRRQAVQAGGVAAVVAAIALAGVGLSGGFADRSAEPPVLTQGTGAPSPTEPTTTTPPDGGTPKGVVTTIPDSVDLVRDWVDDDGDGEEVKLATGPDVQWLGDVVECEASHSPADESVDHFATRLSMPESAQARDLRVFADDATAQRVAEDYVSWFADCPSFSLDQNTSETRNEVTSVRLGDQGWIVSQTYWADGTPQLAENALVVTRVANTILVAQRYGEYPGATNPDATEEMHADFLTEVRPIVDDLRCAFGGVCKFVD